MIVKLSVNDKCIYDISYYYTYIFLNKIFGMCVYVYICTFVYVRQRNCKLYTFTIVLFTCQFRHFIILFVT